jgi:hypothetical protein
MFLIGPYSLSYDLLTLTSVMALQVQSIRKGREASQSRLALADLTLITAVAALPAVIFVLGVYGLPISPLVIVAAWLRLSVSHRGGSTVTA